MRQPVPPMPLAVLVIFVGLYALATLRGVHLGVVMLPAAFVVGVGLVHLAMRDITTGFPVGIMLLLVGVTYFFGMAQANGTIDRLIASALGSVVENPYSKPSTASSDSTESVTVNFGWSFVRFASGMCRSPLS